MPAEQIVLEIEERPAVEATRRANRELENYERTAARAAQSAGRAWQGAGETIVRVSDRSRGSIERMVRAVETRATLAGKTGLERLVAERDLLLSKLAGEERAIERARAAYDRLIAAQKEGAAATSAHAGSLGALIQHLAGAYLSFEGLRRIIELTGVETAKQAARYNTLGIALQATAQANNLSTRLIEQQERAIVKLGITGTIARQSLMRMATAQIDLSQATELARLAQNAAVIAAMNSSEAFDHLIYGLQSGQVRVLRTIGINVDFQESYERLAKSLGKTTLELTDYEKVQARTNEVLRVAPRFAGIYEAAMTDVGKRMTSLARYFEEAQVVVGQKFQPALRLVIDSLTELFKLIERHPEIGAALAVAATGGLGALAARILGGAGAAKVVAGVGA
ncbi:MAG: hypothetical protein ACUVT2_10005, partial [Thiobacillaceae bacterium]